MANSTAGVRRLARGALVPMAASLLAKALGFVFALLYLRVLDRV